MDAIEGEQATPIVATGHRLGEYQFQNCPANLARQLIAKAGERNAKIFECFLQLTESKISDNWKQNRELEEVVRPFLGAIHSSRLLGLSPGRAFVVLQLLLRAFKGIDRRLHRLLTPIAPSAIGIPEQLVEYAEQFEKQNLNSAAQQFWSGWPVKNVVGQTYWLPLVATHQKFGALWTQRLHEAVAVQFSGSRAVRVPALSEFTKFLKEDPISAEELRNPFFLPSFWRRFWDYYRTTRKASVRKLHEDWKNHWCSFVATTLVGSGLLAKTPGRMPGPDKNGEPAGGKSDFGLLLVEIPPSASDTRALEKLVAAIPRAIDFIKIWSESECQDLYSKYRRRRVLAIRGTPRIKSTTGINTGARWLVSNANPDRLANSAASFALHGFNASPGELSLLYSTPLPETARDLGLPVAGSLLPFAAQLVLEHPEITPSFLENLKLYNKNGKLTGFSRQDGGSYLIGEKGRKGRGGQQPILLNHRSSRIVWKLILITAAARIHLRELGDDAWRSLFLTTGKGFGRPRPVKRFATDTSGSERVTQLSEQFVHRCSVDQATARALAERFSLRTLRQTVALGEVVKTHSEEAMSEALGHARFDPLLLARYLPEPFLAFFRERWLRAFQTNLLIEVTKGTGYELLATGLTSRQEIEEFLEANALPHLAAVLASQASNEGALSQVRGARCTSTRTTQRCPLWSRSRPTKGVLTPPIIPHIGGSSVSTSRLTWIQGTGLTPTWTLVLPGPART